MEEEDRGLVLFWLWMDGCVVEVIRKEDNAPITLSSKHF